MHVLQTYGLAIIAIIAGVGWIVTVVSVPAQTQSALYYVAQLSGGGLAALGGSLGGTLVGGLGGGLLGATVQFLKASITISQEATEPHTLLVAQWSSWGAKAGFGLGASIGATLGVIYVGSVFGMAGNPQGAMIGAFAGGLLGMVFLSDSSHPFFYWQFIQTAKVVRAQARWGFKLKLFVNPLTLATLGATIGYNLGTKPEKEDTTTITMPLFTVQF